jgi:outer membrane lipoprotein-sorting protein
MTTMVRASLVLTAALLLGACAAASPPSEPSAETEAAIAGLEDRVDDLAADLADELQVVKEGRNELQDRISALSDKLDKSLARLRDALAAARSGSSEAADAAASALNSAQSVAADLEVLEQRYEYHLRRYHGGGG